MLPSLPPTDNSTPPAFDYPGSTFFTKFRKGQDPAAGDLIFTGEGDTFDDVSVRVPQSALQKLGSLSFGYVGSSFYIDNKNVRRFPSDLEGVKEPSLIEAMTDLSLSQPVHGLVGQDRVTITFSNHSQWVRTKFVSCMIENIEKIS